jgi:hypothetical protein
MKKLITVFLLLVPSILFAQGTVDFNDYFVDKTMRVDFYMTGNFDEQTITLDQVYLTDGWAGNPKKITENINNGLYCVKIYRINSNELIYLNGFGCIFGEYRTTKPARNGVKKTFIESALVPCPKEPVLFVLESRDRKNILHPIFIEKINPADANIIKDKPDKDIKIYEALKNGPARSKVDFVFVSEGYTADQWDKFVKDVNHFTNDVLFRAEPFKSNKEKFNVTGVFKASSDAGVDEPREGRFKRTVVSASYNALDLDRYLLVDDTKAMRDIASAVPYDAIIVLANTTRYGGGGIYNNYTIFTSDNNRSEEIFLHEFGHGFGGLADEYFGGVSYEEFFAPQVEPLEANITALLDPNNVKWKHLLSPGIPIPTPWGQEETAELEKQRNEIREQLRAKDISEDKRKELEDKNRQIREQIRDIRKKYEELYNGKVGVFEGAGYQVKGLYRSQITIGSFDNKTFKHGPVSEEAIIKVINHYAD